MSDTKIVQPVGKAARSRYNQQNPYEQQDLPRKAAIYVRVSREEQALGHSLEAQERECREYLMQAKPNWELVDVFTDEHSGKTDKRPGFQKMIELIESGQADTIVCHHLDRFSRNLHDILSYFKQLEAKGTILAFSKEDFDFSTPDGMLHFHILAVFADWYLKNLTRETKKGKFSRIVSGKANNQLPFGYIQDAAGNAIIVEDEAKAIKGAFERYVTGNYTDRQVADWLKTQGFISRKAREWHKDNVRTMLNNDFYYGVVRYHDDLYNGSHAGIITKELFEQTQEVRRQHARQPRSNAPSLRVYLLNTIAHCSSCDRTLRAQGGREDYRYYREPSILRGFSDCPHRGLSIHAGIADEQIGRIMQAFRLPENWQEIIKKMSSGEAERQQMQADRKRLEERLHRIVEMYEDAVLTRAEYEKRRTLVMKELDTLVLPDGDNLLGHGMQIETFHEIWPLATPEEQREICRLMLASVVIDLKEKRIVRLTPNQEFLWFFKHNHLLREEENRADFLISVNLGELA
ncbi:MAG: recombinase family protein [Chloroflexi bacterium]|nr:recombinase family protein [Chloroflexota bacterium]